MKRVIAFFRSPDPLLAQLFSVFLAGSMIVGIGFVALTVMRDSSQSATDNARAAALAAEVSETATRVELMATSWSGATGMQPRRVVEASDLLGEALKEAEELHQGVGTSTSLQLLGAVRDAHAGLLTYAQGGEPRDLLAFSAQVSAVRTLTGRMQPGLSAAAKSDQGNLGPAMRWAFFATLIAMALGGLVVGGTTLSISRRLRDALTRARQENQALEATTEAMRRRNGQFQALYQIVTEVTETLSMKYVVQTTIREARQLVDADVVILRLLRGDKLEVAGTVQDDDADVASLVTLKLGTGLVGRAAKRGRSVSIAREARTSLTAGEGFPGAQSGIIVPLIVGARVVGTLSCWSARPDLFAAEDEQVLEMMASQVATAVVAADTHETSEHEAHHDPLTSLPNRRQLARDTTERFDPLLHRAGDVAVAMIDIDHFKHFNDEFGHKVGDVTLQRVADVFRTALREGDHVYRFGGEEFVILFEGLAAQDAAHLLDRVRQAVARTPLVGENLEPIGSVTISAGLAFGPGDASTVGELIQFADTALYRSKREGRNRVSVYDPVADADPAEGTLPAAA